MEYTSLVKKAINIAYRAHDGQLDKCGVPYIFHPFTVAMMMKDEYRTVVALLHDVVEDTDVTLEDLRKDFPEEIITAIELMTHKKGVPYLDYVREIKKNPIARAVKLGDLTHNTDKNRHTPMTEKGLKKQEIYEEAKRILMEEQDEI